MYSCCLFVPVCIMTNSAFKFFFIGGFVWCFISLVLCEKCPNTEFFLVPIQSECGKIRTRINSVFEYFSRNVVFVPGKQLTDTLVNFNFLLMFNLLISFTMESPIIRAFFFSCLWPLLFIWSWVAVIYFWLW